MRHFRYVPIRLLPAALASGWLPSSALVDTHHGHYSVLCEWLCGCPEAWPVEGVDGAARVGHYEFGPGELGSNPGPMKPSSFALAGFQLGSGV